jgi:hypothetical protein
MVRSKLSLQERTRRPRAITATRGRGLSDEAATYLVSVLIAVAAMMMAAMAGIAK